MAKKYTTEDFLSSYKNFERAVTEADSFDGISWITPGSSATSVFELESVITQALYSSRIKVCRAIRNHLQHNDDHAFIAVSGEMIEFLNVITRDIENSGSKVSDIMVRQKALKNTETLQDAVLMAGKNQKKDLFPIVDENGLFVGVITPAIICKILAGGGKMKDNLSTHAGSLSQLPTAKPAMQADSLQAGITYAVIDDKGKYKGVLYAEG